MTASRTPPRFFISRRTVIGAAAGLCAPTAALGQWRRGGQPLEYAYPDEVADKGVTLTPTPACASGSAAVTARQTEGPYYTPRTPPRSDLSGDGEGVALVLIGRVLTTDCRPAAHAALDFWQADAAGRYDNDGYRFRGHQFTDGAGVFRLTTIKPGGYGYASAARPPHIHAKVQGAATRLLTTQLYFPDERNRDDRIFDESLVMSLSEENGVLVGRFDFVLADA